MVVVARWEGWARVRAAHKTDQGRDSPERGDDADGRPALKRRLGAVDLTGFGIGIVIGTGIFTLTGIEARDSAGPGVVISFAIAGVVALLAALCYAELASSVPTAGSAYTYAYATMGEIVAWIIGWDLLLEFALGAAVVAAAGPATWPNCSTCRPAGSARRAARSTWARSPSS
ncbi:hypothetical protein GCM10027614_56100 [Micromonospora vulcania]